MPDEPVVKVDETPTPDVKPVTDAAPDKPADFEALLKAMPADVQEAYGKHVAGLTSALDKERRANKKRDDEAARKEQEAKDAQLSEVEKLSKKLKALEDERNQYAQQVRAAAARDALLVVADKIKIEFASKIAEQDAIRFALEGATFDDDGVIKDGEKVLTAVVADRPYLVKQIVQSGNTNAAARGSSTTPVLDEAAKNDLAARWGVKAKHIK